ncbi:uncharacterized protein LOC119968004 [Scyliorhinus canicula]|uniref:uncharacterized protein LOC119968004 n=1 Tax=Scyliorhinus canicula TaxID=7830 RepID=UPI0018F794F4|nr:uncharacterized protein LOC119968004 [Scyliorhinus canicula]
MHHSSSEPNDPNSKLTEFLTKCEDYQLFQLTKFFRDRLEQAIEEGVDGLSSLLTYERIFSGQEHRKITELVEKGNTTDSSRFLLNLVMEKGSRARRVMWESFVKMRQGVPKLDKILKEIQELGFDSFDYMNVNRDVSKISSHLKDVQQKHKETLRAQTETLTVNTILIKEKVKISQLVDRYAELTVISTVRDRTLVEHELLARGRDHEEWRKKHLRRELEKIRMDQLFQSSFSQRKSKFGNSAAVIGVLGIGKTTMVQKIVCDWATGKIYSHFQFVFSFKFRDLNSVNCRINLRNLILFFYPYFGNVLGELWKNPGGLLFIFDSLDEFKDFGDKQRNAEPQSKCTDPECWCEVSDIVYSLIQHKLLPGCSVLVTSRPTALHLLEKAEISVWAEILGFVGDERKEYFNKFFEDQTVAAAVFKHVEENEILYTMCYNPSYCWILGLSLGPFFTQSDRKQQRVPKTITQLYSYYIYNILKNHSREIESPRDVLLKLGEMAFTGVSEKKIVFRNGDLIKYNLQPSQFLSGFLMELIERDVSAQSVVYTFPHLTIQEFVAALALFLTPDPGDIGKLLSEAQSKEDGRFEIFLRFVAGLSSLQAAWPLEEFLGKFLHQTTCRVIDWVKEKVEGQIGNTESETGKRNLLNTFHYLFEPQNKALAQKRMGSVEILSFSELRLTPIDCAVLSHVIGLCDTMKQLDLENCYIQCEGLQWLRPVLHKCQELRLSHNNLGDSGVKLLSAALRSPECKIQKLNLYGNALTGLCAEDLSSALRTNRSLMDLDLGDNKLGDSGVKLLSAALQNPDCKIQKLELDDNILTDGCAEDLASALSKNQSLIHLNLGNNKLEDSGVKVLSAALRNPDCKIQKLELEAVSLTDSCAEDLASVLSTNHSLNFLNLRSNTFTDQSVPTLLRIIETCRSLEWITLEDNQFSLYGKNQLTSLQGLRPLLRVTVYSHMTKSTWKIDGIVLKNDPKTSSTSENDGRSWNLKPKQNTGKSQQFAERKAGTTIGLAAMSLKRQDRETPEQKEQSVEQEHLNLGMPVNIMVEGSNRQADLTPSKRLRVDTDPNSILTEFLTKYDDFQLFQLTQFYQDRLEQAIEEGVDGLSSLLTYERIFSGKEHRKVTELAEKGNRVDSSKLLLNLAMEKGSRARRVMWESFVKMRHGVPKLDKILKEIQEFGSDPFGYMNITQGLSELPSNLKDVQQKHKETLRVQTETLRVNTILIKEKVKIFQLVDRYAELTIISTVRDRTLVEHELLARGQHHEEWRKKHLRRELEKIRTDQLFQSSFSQRKSKSGSSAAVSGVPGIGKTTMVQKIVYDWATGKIYSHFQFVFSFKFRDLNTINCRINLRNLILDQYPYFGNVLGELWEISERLLFIFDGLDEFKDRIDFAKNTELQSMCTDPECQCEVSDIVYSLIQHKLLPGCSVLVTSRPTALHLLEKAEVSVWAEILGFNHEEQKEYFNKFFDDQTVAAAVFKHVEENEILYTMCYNPSYCWILGLSLGPFFTQRDRKQQQVPKTITQLYSYYIYNILKNHGREIESPRDVFLKLGEMAFTGVSEKKIVFRNGDLIKSNLQPSQFLSGFLMELLERDDSVQSVVYTFPHLTIQEFVAALAQFLTPNPGDIGKLLSDAYDKEGAQFEIFLRFVAGLSSPQAAWPLEEFLGKFLHQTTCRVIDWVKEKVEGQIGNTESESGKRNLLNTFHYLFESQNKTLTQNTVGPVKTLTFSELRLTPIDCAVLSHVIGLCDTVKHLDLGECLIQCEGLQQLISVLHKCQELRLSYNNLGDSGVKLLSAALKNPDCKIQKLRLDNNTLTDYCAKDLATALNTNQSLTNLNLSNNKLGDPGVKLLSVALRNPDCKIQKLCLCDVTLTHCCAEDLSSALSINQSLTDLNLGNNNLGDSGMKLLSAALRNPACKIQRLRLNDNTLTDSCAEDLASAVSTNLSLTDLNLNMNKLGDSGMKLLSAALQNPDCKIQRLDLGQNVLTDSCAEDLASALSTNQSLMSLNLNSNSFTDQSVPALRHLIQTCRSLEQIVLVSNRFSPNGKRQLESLQEFRPRLYVTCEYSNLAT